MIIKSSRNDSNVGSMVASLNNIRWDLFCFVVLLLISASLLVAMQSVLLIRHIKVKGGGINENCPWCIEYSDQASSPDMIIEMLPNCLKSDRLFVADILFMKSIYYFGKQSIEGGKFAEMYDSLIRVINVDKEWYDPYAFGAIVLPLYAGDPQGGYDIIERGLLIFKNDWRLYFFKGYIEWKYFRDNDRASVTLYKASRMSGAPRFLIYLASTLSKKSSQRALTDMIVQEGLKKLTTEMERNRLIEKLEK